MGKVLYLGTDPENFTSDKEIIHYPVIRIVPRGPDPEIVRSLPFFSHVLFTSKNTVEMLCDVCEKFSMEPRELFSHKSFAVGRVTGDRLRKRGIEPIWEAVDERQEGMIPALESLRSEDYILYPRSSRARPFLSDYLAERGILHKIWDLYDTVLYQPGPLPSLDLIDEIVFTSPSTVEGFFALFPAVPKNKKISFQGSITEEAFGKHRSGVDYLLYQ